jgi:hypothetical protein
MWLAIAGLGVAAIALLVGLLALGRARGSRGRVSAHVGASNVDRGEDALRIDLLASQLDSVAKRVEATEVQGKLAIQRVGVVRYNPFADTGSNQSFVLAMLDDRGNGYVLSSLHSRQQTRVFLKQVTSGKADSALSEEESEAIRRAAAS